MTRDKHLSAMVSMRGGRTTCAYINGGKDRKLNPGKGFSEGVFMVSPNAINDWTGPAGYTTQFGKMATPYYGKAPACPLCSSCEYSVLTNE
jgi:hypothetical protein